MTEKALKPFLNYEEQINNLIEQKGIEKYRSLL